MYLSVHELMLYGGYISTVHTFQNVKLYETAQRVLQVCDSTDVEVHENIYLY